MLMGTPSIFPEGAKPLWPEENYFFTCIRLIRLFSPYTLMVYVVYVIVFKNCRENGGTLPSLAPHVCTTLQLQQHMTVTRSYTHSRVCSNRIVHVHVHVSMRIMSWFVVWRLPLLARLDCWLLLLAFYVCIQSDDNVCCICVNRQRFCCGLDCCV